ncbi:hypothetical protein [Leifsonia sp. SIMBA_070]|uniref:hypothetical protein n=1 Tax=Leifsonia sp. SIMBA_070 TaxID=3085810 RepID=UPI00397D83D8
MPYTPFLSDLVAEQVAYKGRDDLVFSDAYREHLRRTRVSTGSRSWFKTTLIEAELEPTTLHDLRTRLLLWPPARGPTSKRVQRMLGHASAAMTLDLSADLFDDDLDDVAMRLRAAVTAANWDKPVFRDPKTPEITGIPGAICGDGGI